MSSAGLSFGSTITIIAAAVGEMMAFLMAHAAEPKHPEAAHEVVVSELAIRVSGLSTDVERNKDVLTRMRQDINALRLEQRNSTERIISAIEEQHQ